MMIIKPGSVEVTSSPPVGPNEGLAGGEIIIHCEGSAYFNDGFKSTSTAQEVPTDISDSSAETESAD